MILLYIYISILFNLKILSSKLLSDFYHIKNYFLVTNYTSVLDKIMKRISKYRSNGIRVVKFNIGKNNYDKTMIYYKSGKPKMERNYKNGNLDGNLISYWENGIVHTRGQYKKNRRIGVWNTFDKKGKMVLSEQY